MHKDLLLQEGDVFLLEDGHIVYTTAPAHLAYGDRAGDWTLVDCTAVLGNDPEWDYLGGKYIVTSTCMKGGGQAHDGAFPDGHYVECVKVGHEHIKVAFYQTGCFNAVNRSIEPIGRATKTWVITDND